jgi:hypothetical protein
MSVADPRGAKLYGGSLQAYREKKSKVSGAATRGAQQGRVGEERTVALCIGSLSTVEAMKGMISRAKRVSGLCDAAGS